MPPAIITLRDYQVKAVEGARQEIAKGFDRVLVVMPTGAGKTATASDIAARAVAKGHRVLCLMHRRQLVEQMKDRFADYGLDAGVIMSGVDTNLGEPIQIGTIQTYARRLQLGTPGSNPFFINASVVLIDESHHALSKIYQRILSIYKDKKIIGITATPVLSSGVGMGEYFQSMVVPVTVQELIDKGHLVPAVYWGPSSPDLTAVRITAGDYNKKDLNKVMNQPKLVGDVVQSWLKIAGGKQSMVFCVKVDHSKAVRDEFLRHGVACEHLDAHSDDDERSDVLRRFRNGDIQVLTNCALYTEGSDISEIQCVVMARPVRSAGFMLQIIGRGARPHPGKDHFIVIDHSGNVERLGFYEDDRDWDLNGRCQGDRVVRPKEKEPRKIIACEMCSFMFSGGKCPKCGHIIKRKPRLIESTDDELVQIGGKEKKMSKEERRLWYGMFEYIRREKNYAKGWVAHKYREKTGVWPRGMEDIGPIAPTQEFRNWMKHLAIKFSHSKKRAEAVW